MGDNDARVRWGVARLANGRWVAVADLDGEVFSSPHSYATEAEAVAAKDQIMGAVMAEVLDQGGVRVEHRKINVRESAEPEGKP